MSNLNLTFFFFFFDNLDNSKSYKIGQVYRLFDEKRLNP
jgi:hypothetical protein